MLWSVQFFSEFGNVPTTSFSPSFSSGGVHHFLVDHALRLDMPGYGRDASRDRSR
jgi:hypothetical protein